MVGVITVEWDVVPNWMTVIMMMMTTTLMVSLFNMPATFSPRVMKIESRWCEEKRGRLEVER